LRNIALQISANKILPPALARAVADGKGALRKTASMPKCLEIFRGDFKAVDISR